jgi:hypothetical protein
MLEPSFASTAVDTAPKIKLSKDSLSEILLINHQRKICKKIELLNSTSFLNFILKCNIVSVAPFTPELLKSDLQLIEEADFHLKEFKEMLLVKFKEKNNDCFTIVYISLSIIFLPFHLIIY